MRQLARGPQHPVAGCRGGHGSPWELEHPCFTSKFKQMSMHTCIHTCTHHTRVHTTARTHTHTQQHAHTLTLTHTLQFSPAIAVPELHLLPSCDQEPVCPEHTCVPDVSPMCAPRGRQAQSKGAHVRGRLEGVRNWVPTWWFRVSGAAWSAGVDLYF